MTKKFSAPRRENYPPLFRVQNQGLNDHLPYKHLILVTRMDGVDDVLVVKTYLVDAEVPFLCSKQTLESWNFKIDGTAGVPPYISNFIG